MPATQEGETKRPQEVAPPPDLVKRTRLRKATEFVERVGRSSVHFLIVLGFWWAFHAINQPPENILVSPWRVLETAADLMRTGILTEFIELSLRRLLVSLVLCVAIGVPVGLLLGLNRYISVAFEPFLRFFQGVSGIAWLPLALVWFGFTETTIQVIIVYTMIIPIIFNTMIGIRTVPDRYRDMCRSLGGGWPRILRDVYLPGMLPSTLIGIRLGIGYGWRALIAGEFIVGGGGLGSMIFTARGFGQIDRIIVGMIMIGVLFLVMDRLILQPMEEATVSKWGLLRV